ncbi:MAG: hypothetical protein PSX79_13825 [bacterium]|nr:hypothetical protein [bacterium]
MRRLLLVGPAILTLAFGAPAWTDTPGRITAAASEEALVLAVTEAKADVDGGDTQHAREVLERNWRRKDFATAPPALRRVVLLMIAGLAMEDKDWPTAKAAILPASESTAAEAIDWTLRVEIASRSDDTGDTVHSLTVIAERFPATLAEIEDSTIAQWRGRARLLPDGEARVFALTDAMMRAKWAPQDPFVDLGSTWREYVLGLIARDRIAEAEIFAARITNDDDLITMRADKRFDRIGDKGPDRLSPKVGSLARLKSVEALIRTHPDLLSGYTAKSNALLTLNRPEEALAVADLAIAKASADPKAFTDLDRALAWTHSARDSALRWLGRNEEALEALAIGARVPENGYANVNQTLNLAIEQVQNGQAKGALTTVATVRLDRMSPYGRSVGLRAKACAYVLLGDTAMADTAIGDLKALGPDGKRNLAEALLCRDDLDGYATLMIERLADPLERDSALLSLQELPSPPHPLASTLARRKRLSALRARPDILAAVAPIGRIDKYDPEDLWPPAPR